MDEAVGFGTGAGEMDPESCARLPPPMHCPAGLELLWPHFSSFRVGFQLAFLGKGSFPGDRPDKRS